MQLNKNRPVMAALVLAAAFTTVAVAQPCDGLWTTDTELWATTPKGTQLVLTDPEGMTMPRWSPSGERIAYARAFHFDRVEYSTVRVVDETGSVLRSLPIPSEFEVTAIEQVGWRGDQHVFVEAHVNPSTTKYLEWDVASGQLVTEKIGSWFTVSPNGRYVAQRAHVPHGAPHPYDTATLLINDAIMYPTSGDKSYRQFAGNLVWSPDSNHLAAIEVQDDTSHLVVVAPAEKRIRRLSLPAVPTDVSWSATNTVVLRSEDGEDWQVDVDAETLRRVNATDTAQHDVAEPPVLRTRGVRLADTRCRPTSVE